jgi:hypothetical protein
MNVKKEVLDKCKSMVQKELNEVQYKIRCNKYKINELSKEQRVLKAELGRLFEIRNSLK